MRPVPVDILQYAGSEVTGRWDQRAVFWAELHVKFDGPHYYGSKEARWAVAVALKASDLGALKASDLVAATRFDEESEETHGLVDHVAMPRASRTAIQRIWGKRTAGGDEYLSDHRGVCIGVDLGGGAGR